MMNKQKKYLINNKTRLIFLLLFFFVATTGKSQYLLRINYIDKDTLFNPAALKLQTDFPNKLKCAEYINKLPSLLMQQGYMAASVDSVSLDSSFAMIQLYTGKQQKWVQLKIDSIDKRALAESGFTGKNFINKPLNILQIQQLKERILYFYEKNGYPFAAVHLDSMHFMNDSVKAVLKVSQGPLYHIDSIRIIGKVKISNKFIQQHLGIENGSIYNKEKLQQVSRRLSELTYVTEQQSSDVTLLGSGGVLNIYLLPKRSSQVNFLIGVLPANSQTSKLQLTGDVNLNLKNAFGVGESILLNWQQLQVKSPRLNIGYQQPYFLKSPFGVDFSFELFKKDSSYLQINALLGIQYLLSTNQTGKVFYQIQSTTLLVSGVDTNLVISTKQLPANIDVSSSNFGIQYNFNNTNYKFNPKYGNEVELIASVGSRRVKKNNDILAISDTSFNYASLYDSIKPRTYQLRVKLSAAHYFSLGKQAVIKTSINGGVFNSPGIFRNELFQIGGYKLLRGFDEESIYATRYAVATAELRYLVGLNSYLFYFIDAGWVKNKYQSVDVNNNFIGTGIGLVFETKLGLLNISYAIGKRNDVNFNLREASKIHFGYISYF